MLTDLPLIVVTWLVFFIWQIVGFPWAFRMYSKQSIDVAWGFGRLITWLILGTSVWFLSHLGLPVNQPFFIYTLFFAMSVLAAFFYQQNTIDIKNFIKKRWQLILTQEIIFLIFFVFLCVVRGFQPRIEGLEKFMDVGFMAGYLRSPTLPAEDIWLAGEKINYYTFGHFLGAIVTQFLNVGVEYSYNLILGLIMGMVAMQAASLIINLVHQNQFQSEKKWELPKNNFFLGIKAAVIGGFLLVLAGNGHASWYLLSNRSFKGYWYPDATRFIDRTIHEFPAYSFIVSDLHAHVWSMPLVLFILFNVYFWINGLLSLVKENKDLQSDNTKQVSLLLRFHKIKLTDFFRKLVNISKKTLNKKTLLLDFNQDYMFKAVLIGGLLGLAISTSTWDFLIYALFTTIIGVILILFNYRLFKYLAYSGLVMIAMALLVASPWMLNFDSISEGVRWATERSPIWQLLVLWGPHVFISLLSGGVAVKIIKLNKKISSKEILILAMVITSMALLFLPELIYVKDIYPNHPRANTMFKLTFQAFLMMTLVSGWLVGMIGAKEVKQRFNVVWQILIKTSLVTFILWVSYYSFFGYRDFYGGLKKYQGLDGLAWLQLESSDDVKAINWIRNHILGRSVILEAVGESYTTFARVSTFTGLPTVLGWRVHEWLWRGGFAIPSQRTDEVKEIYENPASMKAKHLIEQYKIKYIFVGSKEKEAYPNIDNTGLINLGTRIFQSGETMIIVIEK